MLTISHLAPVWRYVANTGNLTTSCIGFAGLVFSNVMIFFRLADDPKRKCGFLSRERGNALPKNLRILPHDFALFPESHLLGNVERFEHWTCVDERN